MPIRNQDRIRKLQVLRRKMKLTDKSLSAAIKKHTGLLIPQSTLWNYRHRKWAVRKSDHIAAIDRFLILMEEPELGDKNE